MKWILKHLKAFTAIVVFGITAVVIGVVMITSYTSYKNYENTYYANDLEVRSATAAAPKTIEVNDSYKSRYKNTFTAEASDYTSEGTINLGLYLDAKSFADIEVVVSTTYTNNLLANMNIKVNDSLVEDDTIVFGKQVEAEQPVEEHHLVMSNFALPEGDFAISISDLKDTEIKTIKVFTSAKVKLA